MSTLGPSVARRALLLALLGFAFCFALMPSQATAGRLVATGHDADSHCSGYDNQGQCHFIATAVTYVRAGSTKPMLYLDCSTTQRVKIAITSALGAAVANSSNTICPTAAGFAGEDFSRYSAIIVGSSLDQINIAGSTTTPDSNAIAARKAAIETFFNNGGGIFALAGDINGDGLPSFPDTYYSFIPIPLGGKSVTSPFRLTPEGQALGFQDSTNGIGTNDDINCCPTHNSFQEPAAGSALQVAERDGANPPAPETLFADGTISGGTIVKKPTFGQVVKLPSNRKCVSRRKFRIRIRQPGGIKIQTALVFVNGKRVATVKRKIFKKQRTTAKVNLRGLPAGTFKVRIVVLTTDGATLKGTRKYKTCAKKRRSTKPPKL
jgi:hypothetical protein